MGRRTRGSWAVRRLEVLFVVAFQGLVLTSCGGGGGGSGPTVPDPPAPVQNSAIGDMWADPEHFGPDKTRPVETGATVRARFDCGAADVADGCDVLAFLIDEDGEQLDESGWEGSMGLEPGQSRVVTFEVFARVPGASRGVRFMMHLSDASVPSPMTRDLLDQCTYCITWE